jgi:hypothetical protein
MCIYFYFCATTVNILSGFYTPQNYSHGGFKIYDAVQQINIFIFFSNAMLMKKSKYAKVKNNSCNAKNKYG